MQERNINRLPLTHAPTREQTRNLGKCPAQESNRQLSLGRMTANQLTQLVRARTILFFKSRKSNSCSINKLHFYLQSTSTEAKLYRITICS